ncbi:MAG TPA: FAD-dependent oxidoreductase [Novosphingobium sp.]|nr:FAD-dependent oxidoreductase [Novosphingobium sp.]
MTPPGISAEAFAAAIGGFRAAVGADWVFTSDEDVGLYRDAFSPAWGEAEERLVSAAVAPASSEEVQAVMRIAHKFRIPIYPISTGKNLGYGGSAPNLSGSVVLDLKRMNKVLAVDDKRHFAIVEPGVSYFDLYHHIRENNLQVWLDVPGPGWGSPIGNALDHGVGDTWGIYRNHFSAHCGMEVVLADGTLVRTGMGALPGADTWAEYPYGFGPTVDGLFAQSNFGVVTKMGFWLMPAPEAYASLTVSVPRRHDLGPLIDFTNAMEHQGLCGEPLYSSPIAAEQGHADYQALTRDGAFPSDAALDAFAAARGRPYWSVKLQFYGPREVVAAQQAAARRLALARMPQASFGGEEIIPLPLSESDLARVDLLAFGVPSLQAFALTARSPRNPEGADGHLFFSPIIPKSGKAVLTYQRVMWEEFGKAGFPRQIGPFTPPNTWMFRSFACLAVFLISRSDVEQNRKIRSFFRHLIQVAAAHGWGEYRTSPLFQDDVRAAYSFNDNALLGLHERLKDAIDPQGILAAGRYGIWPGGRKPQ